MKTLETRDLGLVCGGAVDHTEWICGGLMVAVGSKIAIASTPSLGVSITAAAGPAIVAGTVVGCGAYMAANWVACTTGLPASSRRYSCSNPEYPALVESLPGDPMRQLNTLELSQVTGGVAA